jgi:hypothetical protein
MSRKVLKIAAAVALAWSLCCAAQYRGMWRPANSTANTITGDISITDRKLSIDILGFTIAEIRKLQPAEDSAVFDAEGNAGGSGDLYRLHIPAAQQFLHRNTICGREDTEFMATYIEGRTLKVAFFSGLKEPVFTVDALANSTDVCGIFSYTR